MVVRRGQPIVGGVEVAIECIQCVEDENWYRVMVMVIVMRDGLVKKVVDLSCKTEMRMYVIGGLGWKRTTNTWVGR